MEIVFEVTTDIGNTSLWRRVVADGGPVGMVNFADRKPHSLAPTVGDPIGNGESFGPSDEVFKIV